MTTATGGPALVEMTDARWERMSWRSRQEWLRAADTLRRQILADVNARIADEASRHNTRRAFLAQCDEIARAQLILDGLPADPDGPKHRHALGQAIARADKSTTTTPNRKA